MGVYGTNVSYTFISYGAEKSGEKGPGFTVFNSEGKTFVELDDGTRHVYMDALGHFSLATSKAINAKGLDNNWLALQNADGQGPDTTYATIVTGFFIRQAVCLPASDYYGYADPYNNHQNTSAEITDAAGMREIRDFADRNPAMAAVLKTVPFSLTNANAKNVSFREIIDGPRPAHQLCPLDKARAKGTVIE